MLDSLVLLEVSHPGISFMASRIRTLGLHLERVVQHPERKTTTKVKKAQMSGQIAPTCAPRGAP